MINAICMKVSSEEMGYTLKRKMEGSVWQRLSHQDGIKPQQEKERWQNSRTIDEEHKGEKKSTGQDGGLKFS